jgi:hypothetical protein
MKEMHEYAPNPKRLAIRNVIFTGAVAAGTYALRGNVAETAIISTVAVMSEGYTEVLATLVRSHRDYKKHAKLREEAHKTLMNEVDFVREHGTQDEMLAMIQKLISPQEPPK